MLLTRKKSKVVKAALEEWQAEGLLGADQAEELRSSIEPVWIDWKRLARISTRISVVCIIVAVFSLIADEAIAELLESLMNMSAAAGMVLLSLIAAGFFWWGVRRRSEYPEKVYTTELIFLFGVLAVAGAIICLGVVMSSGSENFTPLLLLAALVYGILGFLIPSVLVWVFALGCLGGWLGAVTGYVSGWGAYYMGMNYPLRFVVFGAGLTGLGYGLIGSERFQVLECTTRVMGFLYLFIALWIMSIFGNYGDMDNWYEAPKYELFHWVFIFGAVAIGTIYLGLRRDDRLARGFGTTFLFINLYTRFFEYFWAPMHKAVFFSILAASFWLVGSKAERIWNLGTVSSRAGNNPEPPPDSSSSESQSREPSVHDLEL